MGQADPDLDGWIQINGPPLAAKDKDLERGKEPGYPRAQVPFGRFRPVVRCAQKVTAGQTLGRREGIVAVLVLLLVLLLLFCL